jgi:hypothetical protein
MKFADVTNKTDIHKATKYTAYVIYEYFNQRRPKTETCAVLGSNLRGDEKM